MVGIDHIKELVDLSITNINKHHSDLLTDGRITMVTGDGRNGCKAGAPYTAIHVGAASPKLPYTVCHLSSLHTKFAVVYFATKLYPKKSICIYCDDFFVVNKIIR